MKRYEVFLKAPGKDPFEHAGSLDAPDDELALILARETYLRRAEGEAAWVVERSRILEVDPELIEVNRDRPFRHNDGQKVAARRRANRQAAGR
ncbi:MAG: 1,2-phenylacetyl-CoA epoxidase subunit B [Acidimicrobiales bacterium]